MRGVRQPALWLVAAFVVVGLIDAELYTSSPLRTSEFPRDEYPVRGTILASGTILSFNGGPNGSAGFSVATFGATLTGRILLDHNGPVFLWPMEEYPLRSFPHGGSRRGYSASPETGTFDVPLARNT